jgi:hypothetical protein
MAKEEMLEFPGVVTELFPNATFRVKTRERTRHHRPYGGTNPQEPHQGACGRQGSG